MEEMELEQEILLNDWKDRTNNWEFFNFVKMKRVQCKCHGCGKSRHDGFNFCCLEHAKRYINVVNWVER